MQIVTNITGICEDALHHTRQTDTLKIKLSLYHPNYTVIGINCDPEMEVLTSPPFMIIVGL